MLYNGFMDERKSVIKELEEKRRNLVEGRNKLLEGLGGTLIQSIGENDPPGDDPAAFMAEYRKLQKEIDDSTVTIKSLELDAQKYKELEEKILEREGELSRLQEELGQVYIRLGMALLEASDADEALKIKKQQEESLLSKIEEHEKSLGELEEQKGGIFSWLGKNAKIAVEKAFLSKSRSDLQKLYRSVGEEFSVGQMGILDINTVETAKKALEQKELSSSLTEELSELKGERRRIAGLFGSEGTPLRRIQGLEKFILQTKKEIPLVYLKFGSLAAAEGGKEKFSSFLQEGDFEVLQEAEKIALEIAEKELDIKKVKAAIEIDREQAEIERMEKAISSQRRKITAAEEAITGLEKQIAETGNHVEELKVFIQGDHGS